MELTELIGGFLGLAFRADADGRDVAAGSGSDDAWRAEQLRAASTGDAWELWTLTRVRGWDGLLGLRCGPGLAAWALFL